MKLAQLPVNNAAVIDDCSTLCPFLQKRLDDFGVRPGTSVHIIRKQPFRGPVQLHVNGTDICLRYADCQLIQVKNGEC
ncbi:MAG: FeoA family protein, partial [Bacilli bacterium]